MAKKIFGVYLAKLDAPNSEAHARLELPASLWELHDAMDKVQLQENEELYSDPLWRNLFAGSWTSAHRSLVHGVFLSRCCQKRMDGM